MNSYKVIELRHVKITYYTSETVGDVFTGCYGIFPRELYNKSIKTFEEGLNLVCKTMKWRLVSLSITQDSFDDWEEGMAIFEIQEKNNILELS